MIVVLTGQPGAGKSLKLARIIRELLWRNKQWHEQKGFPLRKIHTNLKLSEDVLSAYPGYVEEWSDTAVLPRLRDCDVIWDELAAAMDATQWQNMSLELKRWLQQHRKRGVDIYGTAQDFAQVDKSFRRLTSDLVYITKLIGSPDKSATRPEIKRVWGLCMVRSLDPLRYNEEKSKFEAEGLPGFMWIRREDIEMYDTTADVPMGKYPPLKHIDRVCELDGCGHHKVIHV